MGKKIQGEELTVLAGDVDRELVSMTSSAEIAEALKAAPREDQLRSETASLEAERDGYRAAYQNISTEFGSMKSERDGYRNAYQEIEAVIGSLRVDLEGYKSAYETLSAETGDLKSQLEGYKAAYAKVSAEVGGLSAERDNERAFRLAIESQFETVENDRAGYKSSYEKLASENGGLKSELEGYRRAYQQIESSIGELQTDHDGYKAAYDQISAEIGEIRSQLVAERQLRASAEAERDGYKRAYEVVATEQALAASNHTQLALENHQGVLLEHTNRLRSLEQENFRILSDMASYRKLYIESQQHLANLRAVPIDEDQIEKRMTRLEPDHKSNLVASTKAAQALLQAGDREGAIAAFKRIFKLSYGNSESVSFFMYVSKELFAEAIAARDSGDYARAISLCVDALELNPRSLEIQQVLDNLLINVVGRDLTRECFIFPDGDRATAFYSHAIQTALDFVVYGGIVGDILEFGVLAGWTSRLFAERMRSMRFFGDLHLYDSFSGLPRNKDEIDQQSYDVKRGVWDSEMEMPKEIIDEIGAPIEIHIHKMLSTIVNKDRIHINKGYFSDTLRTPINAKAAIVHLDCDLYQSTREVLDALVAYDVLQDGTVMMFDDWNCNRASPAFGQRRAMREFLEANADRFSVSHFFNYGFNCAAFILHDLREAPVVNTHHSISEGANGD